MHQFRIQLGENLGYFDALFQSFSPELPYSKKRPLLVICPGGAYRFVSDREAEPVALAFSAHGYHTIVLRYPVAPVRYPAALCALAKTVAWAREHAVQYAIDPEAVSVLGFSAGGHLAACLGVFWNAAFLQELTGLSPEQIRPDKLLLAYPVITAGQYAHRESFQNLLGADADIAKQDALSIEKLVHEKMPSCFLWRRKRMPLFQLRIRCFSPVLFARNIFRRNCISSRLERTVSASGQDSQRVQTAAASAPPASHGWSWRAAGWNEPARSSKGDSANQRCRAH